MAQGGGVCISNLHMNMNEAATASIYLQTTFISYANFELGYNSHLLPVLLTYKLTRKQTGGGNSTCQKSRAWPAVVWHF